MAEAPRAGWPARAVLVHHHRGPAGSLPSPGPTTPDPNKSLARIAGTPPKMRAPSPTAVWAPVCSGRNGGTMRRSSAAKVVAGAIHRRRSELLAAVGIDGEGTKHPLGLVEGATENAAVVQALLDDLVGRGLNPSVCRLFIVDGAKALTKAIRRTFGRDTPIQRCQVHTPWPCRPRGWRCGCGSGSQWRRWRRGRGRSARRRAGSPPRGAHARSRYRCRAARRARRTRSARTAGRACRDRPP